jgi:hypothetical protein
LLKDTVEGGDQSYSAIVTLPHFLAYDITQHFGTFNFGDPQSTMEQYVYALDSIANVIPADEFGNHEDEEGLDGVLSYMASKRTIIEDEIGEAFQEVVNLLSKTQEVIEDLPKVTQHKDANPSNWRLLEMNGKTFIEMIDLETLGPARRGWDEGRMYTLTCLDPEKQGALLDIVNSHTSFEREEAKYIFGELCLSDQLEN